MELTNKEKSLTGKAVNDNLRKMIVYLSKKFEGKMQYQFDISMGEPSKKNDQFKADCKLTFEDKEVWIIKATNSYRSDRMKGNEFDIEHIKKLLYKKNDDKNRIKAYFVVPDSIPEKEISKISKLNDKIIGRNIVTYFNGAIIMYELRNLIESKCAELFHQGKRSNILGNLGELSIIDAFENINNLLKWNNSEKSKLIVSSNYRLFYSILIESGVARSYKLNSIKKLKSGSVSKNNKAYDKDLSIVKLTGGKPKTDVYIEIDIANQIKNKILKISVKRPNSSKSRRITVHQGKMEVLLSDLKNTVSKSNFFADKNNFEQLKAALMDFQRSGSVKNMLLNNKKYLDKNIRYINEWLVGYFIFGENNSVLNQKQIANLVVIFDPNSGAPILKNKAAILSSLDQGKGSFYGSPFSWTYPSKKRGSEIQIKAPILLE